MDTIIDESIEVLRKLHNDPSRLDESERSAILEAIAWGIVIRNQQRIERKGGITT